MSPQEMQQFEVLCSKAYSTDPALRVDAHKTLMGIIKNPKFFTQYQSILEKSTERYALMTAGQALTNMITTHWNRFANEKRLVIRNWALELLHKRGSQMPHIASIHVIKAVCRITKLGWFEESPQEYRNLVTKVSNFLQHTVPNSILGMKILNELVTDMNLPLPGQTPTNLRKAAVSFKERCLFHIFQIVMTTLKQIHEKRIKVINDPSHANALKKQVLELGINVLAFDFIGTNPDEASSEVGTIQVPLAWRAILQDGATLALLFDFYGDNTPPHSSKCLELLLYIASVRRSVFSNETARMNFLGRLMEGARNILRYRVGINHPDNYHQFCRLLSKLKSNYQLSDLVRTEGYENWIEMTSQFTIQSFKQYSWSIRSTHYLLQLWDRLISATPYVKVSSSSSGHMLKKFLPDVVDAYVQGRLEMIQAAHTQGNVEDPLDNPDSCEAQLVHMPKLARYQYSEVAKRVGNKLDLITQNYVALCQTGARGPQGALKRKVFEGQLAFMTFVISALIGGQIAMLNRQRLSDGPGEEINDADLCKRIFNLIHRLEKSYMDSRGQWQVSETLELAILDFMRNFRKSYVGQHKGMPAVPTEQPKSLAEELGFGDDSDESLDDDEEESLSASEQPKTEKQKAYLRMFKRMGMGQYHVVINMMVNKIVNNLRYRHANPDIIMQSLSLFSDFVTGYSSGRLMLRLDAVKNILARHEPKDFPFLVAKGDTRKHRSLFHRALSHLIWSNDGPKRFDAFISQFVNTLQRLGKVENLRNDQYRSLVVGTCCDLRGIASATHNSRTYGMLFDSLYPVIFPTLVKAMERCWDIPEVTTAIFKFMIEFVTNKVQRITFDHCSPNGILLFREVSKIACAFARATLSKSSVHIDASQLYKMRYKGISLCLTMLSKIFGGRYVNFGVFELYRDPALRSSLEASLRLAVQIPMKDLFAHPKVVVAFFTYAEVLFRNHLADIVRFPHAVFMHLLNAMKQGLENLNALVSSRCSACLDHLATFYFRYCGNRRSSSKPKPGADSLLKHMQQCPKLFTQLLGLLFRVVLFNRGSISNQWALGKPILSIMLADEEAFKFVRMSLLRTQGPEERKRLEEAFNTLTSDIRPNLEQANRDQFSQKLNTFRRNVMVFLKV